MKGRVLLTVVFLESEQELRRPVPECYHLGSESLFIAGGPREAEVPQLHITVVVHKNIAALQIAVKNLVAMARHERHEDLAHDDLDAPDSHVELLVLPDTRQVVLHVLENHEDVALVIVRSSS